MSTQNTNSFDDVSVSDLSPSARRVISELQLTQKSVSEQNLPSSLMQRHSVHDLHGKLLYACPPLADLFGSNVPELFGLGFLDFVNVQDRVAVVHAISKAVEYERQQAVELRCIEKLSGTENHDGAPTWLEMKLHTIETAPCEKPVILAIFSDISARKQVELDFAEANATAEQASIAKSRFLANTSHELRTPLNAILGFSELLNAPIMVNVGEEKRSEYNKLIHQSASHLLSVLNDILDVSKIESGNYEIEIENFSLSKCLTQTVAMMRGQAQLQNIDLVAVDFEDMPSIVADERAVRQIMINLISNAIKFSDKNSQIKISALRRARTVMLSVEDQGIGISTEHLENLGKPFFQADSKYDRKYEGTGLGLSVVRGLVELHNGEIYFNSARGKGTTVSITLPIHGKTGRRIPLDDQVEKITEIYSAQLDNVQPFNISRNIA